MGYILNVVQRTTWQQVTEPLRRNLGEVGSWREMGPLAPFSLCLLSRLLRVGGFPDFESLTMTPHHILPPHRLTSTQINSPWPITLNWITFYCIEVIYLQYFITVTDRYLLLGTFSLLIFYIFSFINLIIFKNTLQIRNQKAHTEINETRCIHLSEVLYCLNTNLKLWNFSVEFTLSLLNRFLYTSPPSKQSKKKHMAELKL